MGRCPRPRVLHGSGTIQTSENCKFLHVFGSRGFMETMKDLIHPRFTNEVTKVQKEPKRGFTGGHSRGVEMGERGSNHGGGTQHWKPLHPIRGTRKSDALRRRTIGSDTRGLPRSRRQTLRKASFTDSKKKPNFPPKEMTQVITGQEVHRQVPLGSPCTCPEGSARPGMPCFPKLQRANTEWLYLF